MNIGINPFSHNFLKARNKFDQDTDDAIVRNSQGVSQEESMLIDASQNLYGSYSSSPNAMFTSNQAAFKSIFASKAQKIATYRDMSFFPEISNALDTICDEAITPDEHGKYVKLIIKKDLPTRDEKHIRKMFDYIVDEVIKFDQRGWNLFRMWLIDSELFLEKVMNDQGTRIIGMKVLPAVNTYPIYKGTTIEKYVQSTKRFALSTLYSQNQDTAFETNQICYVHWDNYSQSLLDVRGYLEGTIRTWNQYKNLQDSLVIYRLVRAPERRLWNVEAGRLPPGKAEEYLKGLIARYRKNYTYNSESGTVDSTKMFQALTDDYWFIKREGQGTDVTTLQSGMNLGELEDVNMFLTALYTSLKIPKNRWADNLNSVVSNTAPGEITREELKFEKMIRRFRGMFKKIFIDFLCTQLTLSNQVDAKFTREHCFDIEFCNDNAFAEQKKLLNLKSRLEVINMASSLIANKDNPNGLFPVKYVMTEIWGDNEEEYQEKRNQIAEELSENAEKEEDKEPEDNAEEDEEPTPDQEMNQQNQESNAEETGAEKEQTPEGSKEQTPPEEAETGAIQLP